MNASAVSSPFWTTRYVVPPSECSLLSASACQFVTRIFPVASSSLILVRNEVEVDVYEFQGSDGCSTLQSLLDRQVRSADEDAVWEIRACRVARTIQERPGDDHRHHRGLP